MDDADRLALAMRAKRVGRQYACRCPAHNDRSPSLTFWQGHTAVRVKCWSGCDPLDVVAALRALGAWPGAPQGARSGRMLRPPPSRARAEAEVEAAAKREQALSIWAQTEPAVGTLAERYLAFRRGLAIDALAEVERARLLTEVIRFHPRCPRGSERLPAMVSLMRQVANDRPAGVHRVFLDDHGHKLGKGMMLGPVGQAAVKLAPAGGTLVVCEGVETGVALAVQGERPVWAMGSAGAIERLAPVAGVGRLIVRADHDANGVGQRAAAKAVTAWTAKGLKAEAACPPTMGRDYADVEQ